MSEIAVITGGTSGIGRATALCLRDAGYDVYELSRRPEGVEGLHHIRCDITDEDQVRAAVAEIIGQAGRIDVLINNAGFGISGAVEFTDTAEAQRLLDVNFFGMVRMNKAVIPHMRRAGRGRIVNLSSVAAPCPIPFQAYYSAGKAAVNAYTMALANELRPFGITVCAVQPGDIHTGFTAARVKTMAGDDVYQGRIGRSVQRMEHDEQTGMDPAKAGAFIARAGLSVLCIPDPHSAGTDAELAYWLAVCKIRPPAGGHCENRPFRAAGREPIFAHNHHLQVFPKSDILIPQRVAFLRKSGCRSAALFLRQKCPSPGILQEGK